LIEDADVCIETTFYLLWVLLITLFQHGGYSWIISHRGSVSSAVLGHCQAEAAAAAQRMRALVPAAKLPVLA